jgi:predicted nucleic acid-binding protein
MAFRQAIITQDRYTTDRLTSDSTANKFLATGLEGQAEYIVSRDPHLLNLKHSHAMQIVEPLRLPSCRAAGKQEHLVSEIHTGRQVARGTRRRR